MTDAPSAAPEPTPSRAWAHHARRESRALLEFAALCGIAITQPTLDLLRKNAGLFILWRTDPLELVGLVVGLVLIPPLALWIIEVAASALRRRWRPQVHGVLCGVVGSIITVEVVKLLGDPAKTLAVVLGCVGGAIVAVLVVRLNVVRSWLRLMAILPVAFGLLFLTASPPADVVFDAEPAVADVAVGKPARVVMILMDELPTMSLLDGNGHIDAALYPNFARLADESTWYRNATSVAPFTEAAVPALLSGSFPRSERAVAFASEYPHNLFTLLGGTYAMHVRESVTQLCPTSVCRSTRTNANVRPGFRGMVRDVASLWQDFASPAPTPAFSYDGLGALESDALGPALNFATNLQPATSPRLDFLHVLLPHFPWHYNGALQDYAALPGHTNGLVDGRWSSEHIGALSRVRHLVQTQAADTVLGMILDRLRTIDAYRDALVVVTADHGVAFAADRPIRGVSDETWPEIMWTPLFIKAPNQSVGTVDDQRALAVDVLPTIAEHLQTQLPWKVDGRSLLSPVPADGERPLLDWKSNDTDREVADHYLTFDGPQGFRRVLQGRGAPAGPDPSLRIFQGTPFGSLVGTRVPSSAKKSGATATVDALFKNLGVVPLAPKAPWLDVHGWIGGEDALSAGVPIAVSMNGTIGAISETFRASGSDEIEFWALLPAHLFKSGGNGLALHRIEGTDRAPVLTAIPLDTGASASQG